MLAIDKTGQDYLYQQVIDLILELIESGTLLPGDRLPSLRKLSARVGVSVPTVKQAYLELERQGRVEARPQSGYFVHARKQIRLTGANCESCIPQTVECRSIVERMYDGIHQTGVVPFGIANPCMARPAAKALHRTMKRVMSRAEDRSLGYAPTQGEPSLRRHIALRILDRGFQMDPDDIIITSGGQEALSLCLQAVAKPGDVIAVESPTYHGLLELIESLGMLALEIETCPTGGVVLASLNQAIEDHDIKVCMFSSVVNNPLGSATNNSHRKALVELLESRDIVLIEDDVYGELVFDGQVNTPAQSFSKKGLVLTCSSFSKTAAPGYRIGWVLPGNFKQKVHRLKRCMSCSSGLLQQLTLAEFLASGDYDRHLRALLPVLRCNAQRMAAVIEREFPEGTLCSEPQGGSVLWIQMPGTVDSELVFSKALCKGISLAPGSVFSPGDRYRHFIRLSYGHPWSDKTEAAISSLAFIVKEAL
ncbi:MAG: hypothetical protein DHS20C11_19110 [Lysobacteraceae bacterium]|nr:MAG: hypothetical protein DHS20C11_19110 [Xanthomonadaceae bacterium]